MSYNKNYYRIKAIRENYRNKLLKSYPNLNNDSGIYIFFRNDESGLKKAYVGQALHITERCVSHFMEYDHIALSLKKHGLYSEDNPYGWKLTFKNYPKEELDEHEKATILSCAEKGYQLFNVTAGGQGVGKMDIGERKPAKGYRDGLKQGRKNLAKELKDIIDKHLVIELKDEKKNNKVSLKALEKFWDLLDC